MTDSLELPENSMQEMFLPVHGYVRLFPEEIAVLSHPVFQRLRRVRQLGLAHLLFPGATHTRFEHSVGAVHVAQRIINNIDLNWKRSQRKNKGSTDDDPFHIRTLDSDARAFIRLGALCHDIGHLPFGHTLEDELGHLDKHDGPVRIHRISSAAFAEYEIDPALELPVVRPKEGWSFENLIDVLYKKYLGNAVEVTGVTPFKILKMITLKPIKLPDSEDGTGDELSEQTKQATAFEAEVGNWLPIQVCRDVIGNTICADFLDYLFRDWYHLGKPVIEDKRLYQYMEIRAPHHDAMPSKLQFVINAGSQNKRRHDALTSILDLLESRYRLCETVLFHRTKLSITALLDRCLLEIRRLYRESKLDLDKKTWDQYFQDELIDLLLDGSDDTIGAVLRQMAAGGRATSASEALRKAAQEFRQSTLSAVNQSSKASDRHQNINDISQQLEIVETSKPETHCKIDVEQQSVLIKQLIQKLHNRTVYTLAAKWRIDELSGAPNENNREVLKISDRFTRPENREFFLRVVEAVCHLPPGSVTMYCPPSAKMNAKIADVKLYLDHEIVKFYDYEKRSEHTALTSGALSAQVRRFYHLWSVQFFVDRSIWHAMTEIEKDALRAVLRGFFYIKDEFHPSTVREQLEGSIERVRRSRMLAARSGGNLQELHEFEGRTLPNGLPVLLKD